AAKPSRCFCYAWIAVGPVEVVAGVRACLASLDKKKGSVPVMLDLVDPTRTRRRMIDCGCELRPDKLQRHSIDISEAGEIASRTEPLISCYRCWKGLPQKKSRPLKV